MMLWESWQSGEVGTLSSHFPGPGFNPGPGTKFLQDVRWGQKKMYNNDTCCQDDRSLHSG